MSSPLYALLIGIDAYISPTLPTLQGCRNDVTLIASVLRSRFGVEEKQLRIMVDEEATRAGIKQAFREHLIDPARRCHETGEACPACLFHYSGHGSLARDATETAIDEAILSYDSREPNILDIRDWELRQLFDELARYTPHITVILDTCISGSVALGMSNGHPWQSPQSYVLLSACSASKRIANDYFDNSTPDPTCYGALSYALAEELSRITVGHTTYREVFDRVCRRVQRWHPLQAPHCEGNLDRILFDGLYEVVEERPNHQEASAASPSRKMD